jgi:LacI family transcriptional regulator
VSPTVDTPALSAVTFDNVRGGELAGMHLTSIGRGKLAFLGDPNKVSNSAARLKGFRNAAAERIDLGQLEVIPCGLTVDDGIRVAEQLARRPPLERPDGIFAANDMVAFGATTALLRAGLRVPEDIAIVGFDDVALARQSVVPLTTIRQPAYDMGRAAAAMLLDLMQSGSRTPRRTMFSAELVVRESTRGGSS